MKPLQDSDVYCNLCGTKNRPSKIDNWMNVNIDFEGTQINLRPFNYERCKAIAEIAYDNNQFYEAIEYYQELLKFEMESSNELSNIFNELAISYKAVRDFENSLKNLDLSLTVNPNNFIAYENRANTKISLGDEVGAITDIN